ncbi:class I SAM-dependent methyltransferase [Chitinophaga filiformis]|uniref:class I SAM-dependent methyltransferase n=1 Tax=Chitinophaga filiformis TaxID=104663 RepID=UPI001F460885|nr:methyltransferase domain-containing protein [Chitinophaga filiformis]MCF6406749.1 class I SAM-dependent methyltransferase [Chitinophaga filiformis]
MELLTESALIWSPVVANNRMNRKRIASGVNSYEKDLKFSPGPYLNKRLEAQGHAKWLDLCCGEGNALLQYASEVAGKNLQERITLKGIDLVDQFQSIPPTVSCLQFETRSLVDWEDQDQYDLITCVHGLHYVGDKLKVIVKGLKAINSQGILIANLDLNNIKIEGDQKGNYLKKLFKENEIDYSARTRLIRCEGPRYIDFNLDYKGADDKAGPNYTGQAAVDSYYSIKTHPNN